MRFSDFQYLHDLEKDLWWFRGMKSITASMMLPVWRDKPTPDALDVGCGTGDMMQWLQAQGASVTGLDISPTALHFCRMRGLERLHEGGATNLPFDSNHFDVVTNFDMLVYLPDEAATLTAIREMHRVLRPGGWGFLRAAAYPWMRSSHDISLDSHQRFTRSMLARLASDAGFVIARAGYANAFLLPIAMAHRLLLQPLGITAGGSDVKPLPKGLAWVDSVFRNLLEAESWLIGKGCSIPFGLSVVMLIRKPSPEQPPSQPDLQP